MTQDATSLDGDRANLLEALQEQVSGLTYTSEADYPLEAQQFAVQEPDRSESIEGKPSSFSTETLLQLTGHDADTAVEEQDLQTFFAPMLEQQEWHKATELMKVDRYQNLVRWLEKHLSETKVYRVGEVEIDIYIIGKTPTHDWLGLTTKVIET